MGNGDGGGAAGGMSPVGLGRKKDSGGLLKLQVAISEPRNWLWIAGTCFRWSISFEGSGTGSPEGVLSGAFPV